jgi:hypothetical protein
LAANEDHLPAQAPHQVEAQNGSHNLGEVGGHRANASSDQPGSQYFLDEEPGAHAPGGAQEHHANAPPEQPGHSFQYSHDEEPNTHAALEAERVNSQHPVAPPDERLAMASPHSHSVPAEGSNAAPEDAVPGSHLPAQRSTYELEAEQKARDLVRTDARTQALHDQAAGSAGFAPDERIALDRNLAEILAFTGHTRDLEQRQQMLAKIEDSLRGPRLLNGETVFPLRSQYIGENVKDFTNWKTRGKSDPPGWKTQNELPTRQVEYFSPQDQENHRVFVGADGTLRDTNGSLKLGKWMFVVDENGRMIAVPFPKDTDYVHHSSLSAGGPVRMAGDFMVDTNGRITIIKNASGHFRPDAEAFKRFVVALEDQGADLSAAIAPSFTYVPKDNGLAYQLQPLSENLLSEAEFLTAPKNGMLRSLQPTQELVRAQERAQPHAGRDAAAPEALSAREAPNPRLALVQDNVSRIIKSDPEAASLSTKAHGLAGNWLGSGDLVASDRTLAEILEFKKQRKTEGQQLLQQFGDSLQPLQPRPDGLTEFRLMPQYVGENVVGFDNWKVRDGGTLPGEKYAPGNESPTRSIRYFSEQERKQAQVYITKDGYLAGANGSVLTGSAYTFVVDSKGRFIAVPSEPGRIHHSTLSGGEPVLMAGEFSMKSDGTLQEITNKSGHFRPDQQSFERFVAELLRQNVKLAQGATAKPVEIEGLPTGGIEDKLLAKNLLAQRRALALRAGPADMLDSFQLAEGVRVRAPPQLLKRKGGFGKAPAVPGQPARPSKVPGGYNSEVPAHPNGAQDQPITWELPPLFRFLGASWGGDSREQVLRLAA